MGKYCLFVIFHNPKTGADKMIEYGPCSAGRSQVLGKIEFEDQPIEMENPNVRNLIGECSITVSF